MARMSAEHGRSSGGAHLGPGTWQLPAGSGSVPRARHLASQRLDELGVTDAGVRGTAELLVSELVSNVIKHTASRPTLHITRHQDLVRIEVTDEDSAGVPLERDVNVEAEHGRGLLLVAALASSWGYDRDGRGKRIWVELDLREPSALDGEAGRT